MTKKTTKNRPNAERHAKGGPNVAFCNIPQRGLQKIVVLAGIVRLLLFIADIFKESRLDQRSALRRIMFD